MTDEKKSTRRKSATGEKKAAAKTTAKRATSRAKAGTKPNSRAKRTTKTSAKKTGQSSLAWYQKLKPSYWFSFRWIIFTSLKIGFALAAVIAIYSIYLDGKVRDSFEGQRWQVPAQIYSRALDLSLGQAVHLDSLKQELKLLDYRASKKVTRAGEFALTNNSLQIFQRRATTADGSQSSRRINLTFANSEVVKIVELTKQGPRSLNQFFLEPMLVTRLDAGNNEDRVLVELQNVPQSLIDTLILVEDRDFYHHQGISPVGIARAMVNNLFAGRIVQGGSTLTQQLAKNMYLSREKKLIRKINEALIALILEYRYSKDQLLEAYINEIYLGQHYADGIYGFGLAAQFYFGKPLAKLNTADIATLVGQIKGPSYYDPWRHPERAMDRRDVILKLMLDHELISLERYKFAVSSQLGIREQRRLSEQNTPAYMQLVKRELKQILDSQTIKSGIQIFTGLSPVKQAQLEQATKSQLAQLEKSSKTAHLQAAIVASDISSGEIRAMLGDRKTNYAGFNRALDAKRQIGSLIKPVIYINALEQPQKYTLATPLKDEPLTLKSDSGKVWQPKNYNGKFQGQVPLINALSQSLNVPTVNLGMAIGLPKVAQTLQTLGYQGAVKHHPSLLLGAITMSPVEVSQWYGTIANSGYYQPLHAITKVVSNRGETLFQHQSTAEQKLSAQGAYLINYALNDVSKNGTAKSLRWTFPNQAIAGKTGTSNDLRDSWFVALISSN